MQVAAGFAAVNVSDVQKTSDILAGIGIEFLSYGSGKRGREELARLVAGLGGKVGKLPDTVRCLTQNGMVRRSDWACTTVKGDVLLLKRL